MSLIAPNRINGIIRARLQGLKALLQESSEIEHGGTKGSLRERYLIEFLHSVLPPGYIVAGGFICDVLGNITPQLDLIVADRSTIPAVALARDVAVVPVEVARLAIEVKSTLRSDDLEQVRQQAEAFRSLQPVVESETQSHPGVLLYVLAFEAQVGPDLLRQWLESIPELFGICIFDSLLVHRGPNRTLAVRRGDDWEETLIFISSLLHAIIRIEEVLPSQSAKIWASYVEGWYPDRPEN
jgi:hypothetical protein